MCPEVEHVPLGAHVDEDKGRAGLRVTIPGLGRVYWHRVVCMAFSGLTRMPAELEADHLGSRWWEVRKDHLEFVTQGENKTRQAEAGLAGPPGERVRARPPKMLEKKLKKKRS